MGLALVLAIDGSVHVRSQFIREPDDAIDCFLLSVTGHGPVRLQAPHVLLQFIYIGKSAFVPKA